MGIDIICIKIPGIALVKAPAINAANVKSPPVAPIQTNIAAPQTILPAIIAIINALYMCIFLRGNILYKRPQTAPYVASSNAIQTADGKNGGIPSITERKSGAIKPIVKPHGQPQIKPQSKTGSLNEKVKLG